MRVAGFAELDALTAYRLWQLRESVFVVEQECAYQELDGRDVEPGTRHLWVEGDSPADGPVGYLRLLDDGDHARIGRVLVAPSHRGRGVSGALMRAARFLAREGATHDGLRRGEHGAQVDDVLEPPTTRTS